MRRTDGAPDRSPIERVDVDAAWAAIRARDARMDGRFVYGVRTTGVACRPSCGSRLPRRENVQLFRDLEGAIRAGYRPCARCRGVAASLPSSIARAVAFLEAHLEEAVTLHELARAAGLSPHHLQRLFTRTLGVSPRVFQERRRLERFKARVREGDSVGGATYAAGFGSSRGLYESARTGLGMTPATYRRGGRGEVIRYAIAPCELGRVLVAATGRGVCAVQLGADDGSLVDALRAEFPLAAVEREDAALEAATRGVIARVAGEGPAVQLDLRGTAFQLRVWRALQEIPSGETRSYAEIAARVGKPAAVRAVARACAANRVAVLVPCHRVVRAGGELGGYRWGPERKARLLGSEREAAGRGGSRRTARGGPPPRRRQRASPGRPAARPSP
jgi:AraC family transcriptional regulator of adaptative response/methylated-DNA-[protein]-cysteine methyltransferase